MTRGSLSATAWWLAALALGAAPLQQGRITGRVIDEAGRPVAVARVVAASEGARAIRAATTSPDGTFEIAGLPAGAYAVTAERAGHETRHYGQLASQGPGTPVSVDARRSPVLEIVLPRFGAIAGTIVDETGRPVIARVGASQFHEIYGIRALRPVGTATSDRHGRYRIDRLPPGEYYVSAIGVGSEAPEDLQLMTPAIVSQALRALEDPSAPLPTADASAGAGTVSFVMSYYPATASPTAAVPVAVGPGMLQSPVDLRLLALQTTRVEGVVLDAEGEPASGTVVMLVGIDDRVPRGLSGATGRDGRFVIGSVPHGRYLAMAQTATADVEAMGPVVRGVTLRLAAEIAVAGRVVYDGGSPRPANDGPRQSVSVALVPTGASLVAGVPPPRRTLRVTSDGGFEGGVLPGVYVAAVDARGQGDWYVESVMAGDVDLLDEPIMFREHATAPDLVVTFTDRPAEIAGVVRHADGTPEAGLVMVVIPADRRYWRQGSRRARAVRPDPDGHYAFRGLPPGDYLLAAVTAFDASGGISPEVIEALAPAGTPVSLGRGERRELDFTVGGAAPLERRVRLQPDRESPGNP